MPVFSFPVTVVCVSDVLGLGVRVDGALVAGVNGISAGISSALGITSITVVCLGALAGRKGGLGNALFC